MKQGDFSEYVFPDGRLRQIFDPATTMDNGSGGFTREPFRDNVIPSDRIGAVGRNGAALMVDPTSPGIINNHVIVGGAGENVWLPNVKIDHSWTPNQITRGSYFGTRRDRVRTPADMKVLSDPVTHPISTTTTTWFPTAVCGRPRWSRSFALPSRPGSGRRSTWASLTLREPMHWASAVFRPYPASPPVSISAASLARWAMRTARSSGAPGSTTRSALPRTGPRGATSSSSASPGS